MRIEKDGKPILTVQDWLEHAPPKSPHHWVKGRSAFELAHAWCGSGEPAMPEAQRLLLESREETRGFVLEVAIPEHRIPFDSFGGEPRNADLALTGSRALGRVAITIEAKADEPFGETVSAALASALERGIENPRSNGVRRIEGLAQALFPPKKKGQPRVGDLRYQLLTAVAGTLAFADAQGASIAVLVIHEFVTDQTTADNHLRNGGDYNEFLVRLSEHPLPEVAGADLAGPFLIPGGELFPGGRALFIGKITTDRRTKPKAARVPASGSDANPDAAGTPRFERYIGIDYSGAEVPTASLKGLRVYVADRFAAAAEVPPPPSLRKYWTRRGIAEWLVDRLSEGPPTIVGIDHGFSFPLAYFEKYGVPHDWPAFLDDFCAHWPTDGDHTYVDFVRDGAVGNGAARAGNTRWKRLTDKRAGSAKSLFHFDVQGSVAKSTHSGLPWLRYVRQKVTRPLHYWPFDGWEIPAGSSAVVEVYPRLWNRQFPQVEGRTADQHDAWVVAEWMRTADVDGRLAQALSPQLEPLDRSTAEIEGWILGVE